MANDTSPCRHRFVDSHCGLSACWSGCVSSPGTQYKTKASTAFPSRATFSPTYCPSSRARQLQPYKLPIVTCRAASVVQNCPSSTCTAASAVQTAHRHVHGSFSRTNCPSSRARQLQPYKLPIVTCRVYSLPSSLSPDFFTCVFFRHFPPPYSPPVFLRHFPSLPLRPQRYGAVTASTYCACRQNSTQLTQQPTTVRIILHLFRPI